MSYSNGVNKAYIIQWKSKVNGRAGRGTKLFEREEAKRLVDELNRDYPQIEHEVVEAKPNSPAEAPANEPAQFVGAE